MNTAQPINTPLSKIVASMLKAGTSFLHTRTMNADEIQFSAKNFATAMLAYFISLRIGRLKPFWAVDTVYASQKSRASFICGVYRFAVTLIGAMAAVARIPNLMNSRIVCHVILAGWIGLCHVPTSICSAQEATASIALFGVVPLGSL